MTNALDLTGKVVLVTGGNNGIGLGMAEGLAAAGASLVIWGRNEARNAEALDRLVGLGGEAVALAVDVSDEQAVIDGFAATVDAFGAVDAVFANAGVGAGATPFHEMTTQEWHWVQRYSTLWMDSPGSRCSSASRALCR